MADITKCTNDTCPLRKTCYRYTAKSDSEWQSYAKFEYIDLGKDVVMCPMYWATKLKSSKALLDNLEIIKDAENEK